jgi:hypothetical protein
MLFSLDPTDKLKKFFEKVRYKYFSEDPLSLANIIYCFWEGDKFAPDGSPVMGFARAFAALDRDLFDYDFVIAIDHEYWKDASTTDKKRLAIHELRHCSVLAERSKEGWTAKEDKEGRIRIGLRPHDVNLNLFKKEVKHCGLMAGEEDVAEKLLVMHHESKMVTPGKKKKQKKKKQ